MNTTTQPTQGVQGGAWRPIITEASYEHLRLTQRSWYQQQRLEIIEWTWDILDRIRYKSLYEAFLWLALPELLKFCVMAALALLYFSVPLGLLQITYGIYRIGVTLPIAVALPIVVIFTCIVICGFGTLRLALRNQSRKRGPRGTESEIIVEETGSDDIDVVE